LQEIKVMMGLMAQQVRQEMLVMMVKVDRGEVPEIPVLPEEEVGELEMDLVLREILDKEQVAAVVEEENIPQTVLEVLGVQQMVDVVETAIQ
jgi:hypothetical protein